MSNTRHAKYTPWRFEWIFVRPTIGSRFHYGNYSIGVEMNGHPRFREFVLCLWFINVGFAFRREWRNVPTVA